MAATSPRVMREPSTVARSGNLSKSSLLYAMPPPDPPKVKDGLIIIGKPIFF